VLEATSERHTCGAEGQNGNIMARNFSFWRPYIVLCVDTLLCIGHKWNISVWSYKMSGETFWSGVWFSHIQEEFQNGMQKPKLEI
jgi:hypothetical protein